nr:hypothetical protein [Tanacetum cinerariifolium]
MRIEQYSLMIDYYLWEVILNVDSPSPTRIVDGVVQNIAPTTAEQRLGKKNELKARETLLMALPDKHQLKFNIHKDAKTLMEVIEKSTNESVSVVPSVSAASSKAPVSTLPNGYTLSDVVIYSFFARNANHQGTTGKRHSNKDYFSGELLSDESVNSVPKSPENDRYKTGEGYHVVPPPYTGTFMPLNLIWYLMMLLMLTSDSEDETKIESVPKQKEPSFVPTSKHVKTPRESVKQVEHPKQVENLRTDNLKSRVLTRSRLVSFNAARLVPTAVPQTTVKSPRVPRENNMYNVDLKNVFLHEI